MFTHTYISMEENGLSDSDNWRLIPETQMEKISLRLSYWFKRRCHAVNVFQVRRLYWCAYHCLSLFSGYICSAKLVPVSQYLGTVLVCLLGVACLRGRAMDFCQAGGQWLTLEIKINVRQCRFLKTIFHQECLWVFFFFLKGFGRWKNSEYLQFITILDETKKNHTPENKVWQPNIIFSLDVG